MNKQRKQLVKKTDELIKAAIQKIDDEPKNAQNYYDLGSLLTELKNYEQAEALFRKALPLFATEQHDSSLLYYGLGNVLYAAGLYAQAVEVFQKVQEQKLQQDAYLMLAQSEFAQEHYQQALAFALTAAERGSQQDAAHLLMGESFLALGDFEHAQEYFEQVRTREPQNFKANFELGVINLVLGKENPCYFQQAQKSDPSAFKRMQSRLADIEKVLLAKKNTTHEKKA